MKAYHFTFKGSYLGGNAVVIACDFERASEIMREHLDAFGYENDDLTLLTEWGPGEQGMFYFDTGDY